jgi:hypothetical protein
MKFDRAEKYLFALAIQNCVNGSVASAARPKEQDNTELDLLPKPNAGPPEGIMVNGSILKVYVGAMFPFEELLGKNLVKLGQKQ